MRILSRLISYTKIDLGPTTSIYENTLGGRVAVQGYVPWDNIHSEVKRTQITQICDWLSYGRLPIVIYQCIKVVPFLKQSEDGSRWFVMLLNASLDDTDAFTANSDFPRIKDLSLNCWRMEAASCCPKTPIRNRTMKLYFR